MQRLLAFTVDILSSCVSALHREQEKRECLSVLHRAQLDRAISEVSAEKEVIGLFSDTLLECVSTRGFFSVMDASEACARNSNSFPL